MTTHQRGPEHGRVLILNGTGSAGKSTLARAVQDTFVEPWLHLGIDAFNCALPSRFVGTEPASHEGLHMSFTNGVLSAFEAGPAHDRTVAGLHRAVRALASYGTDVAVDHWLWKDAWLDDCAAVLPIAWFIGVTCPLDVAQERTRARGDRPPGHEAAVFDLIHRDREYDLLIDTSTTDIATCIDLMRTRLDTPPRALAQRAGRAS